MKEELKTALARRAEGGLKQAEKPENRIADYLKRMAPEIAKALPRHMTADRMGRIALTTIRINPRLLECSTASLMAAVMQAAQLGLEPGLLGHCYIIPYKGEAQFIIGYRGMIDLARRSGEIQSISVHEVWQNDFFELQYGLDEKLTHIPWHIRTDEPHTEPGACRGGYMVAKFKDGGYYCHYMPLVEIEKHRSRSKAGNSGPWQTDYEEMLKKTVVRSAWKWLPISVEIARNVEYADETVKKDIAEDMSDIIDVSAIEVEQKALPGPDKKIGDGLPELPEAEEIELK